jgi:hypothetical protein
MHVPLKRFPKRAGSQIHSRYSIRQVAHNNRLQFADNGYGARLLKVYAGSGVPMLLHQGIFRTSVDCSRLFLVKFFTVCRWDQSRLAQSACLGRPSWTSSIAAAKPWSF